MKGWGGVHYEGVGCIMKGWGGVCHGRVGWGGMHYEGVGWGAL